MLIASAGLTFLIGLGIAAGFARRTIVGLRAALRATEANAGSLHTALLRARSLETVGHLAGGAAHEFNNHLTAISSNIELAAQRLTPSDDRVRHHLTAALEGVRRAATLSTQILTLSRQPEPEPEAVDLNHFLERLAALLSATRGDCLTVAVANAHNFVWVDLHRLEIALLSLAMTIQQRTALGATLHITVERDDDLKIVRLICGSAANAVSMWADKPAPDIWGDADFSLPRDVVYRAGGRMEWTSDAVRLAFPQYRLPVPVQINPRPKTTGTTILVVEDDAPLRAVCVRTLKDLGYQVIEAPDAMEAYRLITDRGGIDLLFADIGLPGGVSGRMLADAARRVDGGIRILLTTGRDLPSDDVMKILHKPFDGIALGQAVRQVLSDDVDAPAPAT